MKQDFTNQRFGTLTVIRQIPDVKATRAYGIVECLCDCGVVKTYQMSHLKSQNTQSCGCQRNKVISAKATTHGQSTLLEYDIWASIKQRCYNEKCDAYSKYGGRGITIADEWKNSFETFYKDMGPKPSKKHSIDRRENDEGYNKDNCRWATRKEQQNNVSNNIFYTYKGETKNLLDWCKELELNFSTIYSRIYRGMLFEVAIKITKLSADTLYEIDGITKTLLEWCDNSRLLLAIIRNRLSNGWTFEEALRPIEKEVFEVEDSALTLYEWCCLMDLDHNTTYLRIIRGEKLDTIIKE